MFNAFKHTGFSFYETLLNHLKQEINWWAEHIQTSRWLERRKTNEIIKLRDAEQRDLQLLLQVQQERIQAQSQRLKDITRKESHELRRPLANLLGLVDLLQNETYEPELLQYIKQEAEAIDAIIHDIVKMSDEVSLSAVEPK